MPWDSLVLPSKVLRPKSQPALLVVEVDFTAVLRAEGAPNTVDALASQGLTSVDVSAVDVLTDEVHRAIGEYGVDSAGVPTGWWDDKVRGVAPATTISTGRSIWREYAVK